MNFLYIIRTFLTSGCFFLFAITPSLAGQDTPENSSLLSELLIPSTPLSSVCLRVNALNTRIRDCRIDRVSARIELKRLLAEVRDEYYRSGGVEYPSSGWVFPLAGYDSRAVGGGRWHGYNPRGYDFFSGNRHGGHPSYDIFIRDRNRDTLDDRSGKPVAVLSMTGGIVVALEGEWEPDSRLRGGKYVWVYDPANEVLVYYAHNANLSVRLGEIVRPGDVLGVVGRSGFNAARLRSPTHLHLTVLRVQDGNAVPVKAFQALKRAGDSSRVPLPG